MLHCRIVYVVVDIVMKLSGPADDVSARRSKTVY